MKLIQAFKLAMPMAMPWFLEAIGTTSHLPTSSLLEMQGSFTTYNHLKMHRNEVCITLKITNLKDGGCY